MKTLLKLSALIGVAAMLVVSCNKPEPKPTPAPEPTPVEKPVANFTSAIDGLKVVFTNTSTNATSYRWDFGDGDSSKEASPTHEYASSGEYTVILTAANSEGATSKKEAKVSVAGKAEAYFTYTSIEGRPGKYGKIIAFDATGSQNAASIEWDFGDGTTGSEFVEEHEFPEFGTYTVKATVTGLGGDKSEYSEEVEAVANNELLKGGDCEEDAAQYWTLVISEVLAPWDQGGEPMAGVLAWEPKWGFTEDGPSAKEGGCLQFTNKNLHDQAANILMYQPVEVKAGDILQISCNMKWGDRTNNSGLCWFGFSKEPGGLLDGGIESWDIFNYWAGFDDPSVPAFDGGFAGNEEYITRREELGFSGDGSQDYALYEVEEDGIIYFTMEYRSVWGGIYGEDVKLYFDNFSCKIIL